NSTSVAPPICRLSSTVESRKHLQRLEPFLSNVPCCESRAVLRRGRNRLDTAGWGTTNPIPLAVPGTAPARMQEAGVPGCDLPSPQNVQVDYTCADPTPVIGGSGDSLSARSRYPQKIR